jgi:hypothetical protein
VRGWEFLAMWGSTGVMSSSPTFHFAFRFSENVLNHLEDGITAVTLGASCEENQGKPPSRVCSCLFVSASDLAGHLMVTSSRFRVIKLGPLPFRNRPA